MSSETALSGRDGTFVVDSTQIARATRWNVDDSLAHTSEWGDSDSNGYTNRCPGRLDAKFAAEGKFDYQDEVYNIFASGDILEALLYLSGSMYWTFPRALCMAFKLEVNIDTEEVIGWTSDWGADGEYYYPGEAQE
jgi:hypothetical protein